jgi:hypothetical protein
MALTAALSFLFAAVMTALGRERHRATFGRL